MYYIKNIEDDKLELHFSKAEYMAMPEERKKVIKSSCLFSGQRQCWRSRGKLSNGVNYIISQLKEWGFEDNGSEGEKLSFADQVQREQEKAAIKVDIFDQRHDKAVNDSKSTFDHAHNMLSVIPMGQPILVGHHSERGHRRLLEKHDNTMRKGFELDEKAEYYRNRYNNALHTAEGNKFKNAGYLINRIKECKAKINGYLRSQQGKMYIYSQPKPVSKETFDYYQEKINDETDKQDYMKYCLKQLADSEKGIFTKENLLGKTQVMISKRWVEVVRLNPTTISVMNGCFDDPVYAKKHALKYNYGEVMDAK